VRAAAKRCPYLSGVLIIGVVGASGYLFGRQIDAELAERASTAATQITTQLQQSAGGKLILSHIQGGDGFSIPAFLSGAFSVSVRFLEALVVTVIGGFYLAAQPELIRNHHSDAATGKLMTWRGCRAPFRHGPRRWHVYAVSACRTE
jgi:hypothetical protein